MTFAHPMNGHTVRVRAPRLYTFLFGPLYFAAHGVWAHALISAVAAILTAGAAWLIYPWFARGVMRRAYLARGWQERPDVPAAA